MSKRVVLSILVALSTLGSAAILPETSLAVPVAPALPQIGSESASIDLVAQRRVVRRGHGHWRHNHRYYRHGHRYGYGGRYYGGYYGCGYGYGYGCPYYGAPGVYVGFPFLSFGFGGYGYNHGHRYYYRHGHRHH